MTAEFSADAERRALEPWSIQIKGRVFVADGAVSRPALLAFLAVVERHQRGEATVPEMEGALEGLLRVAFPRSRLSRWWYGDPVAEIMRFDYRLREAALASFFESLGLTASPSAPGTNGTNGSRPSSAAGNGSLHAPAATVPVGASRLD